MPTLTPTLNGLLATALLLAASQPSWAQERKPVSLTDGSNFHLYLLVGQSNMAGRGRVTEADKTPHPRVLMLNKEGNWVPAIDPLHFDKPGIVGVGLGKTFGAMMAERDPHIVIGLVPCAVGGSPIDSWKPGEFYKPTQSHPWDDALRRARLAMKTGTLKGILWHQGESDSVDGLSDTYEAKLHDLIKRFRTELNAENVPFLVGQMGQFEEAPWNEHKHRVDKAHRDLPDKVSNTAFVSSDDLKHRGDRVHFDAESYRILGKRFAEAYGQLIKPKQ